MPKNKTFGRQSDSHQVPKFAGVALVECNSDEQNCFEALNTGSSASFSKNSRAAFSKILNHRNTDCNLEGLIEMKTKLHPTSLYTLIGESPARPELHNPLLEGAIQAVAKRSGAPEGIALQSILGAACVATQAHADVETLASSSPLSLNLVTIAESGERKSTCDRYATSTLRDRQRERVIKYEEKLCRYEQALKDGKEGRHVIDDEDDVQISMPTDPRFIFEDVTTESIFKHLEFGHPSIGIVSAEGAQFLAGYSMKSANKLKSGTSFSKLWDGDSIEKSTATGGSKSLYGKRVCAHLMIQPEAARSTIMTAVLEEQGFTARCLFVFPSSRIGMRTIANTKVLEATKLQSELALKPFHERLSELIEKRLPLSQGGHLNLAPKLLSLSAAARASVLNFYNRCEIASGKGMPFEYIRGFSQKCPEHACRIAGVLTIFEADEASEVSPECMETAIELVEWYLEEMLRLKKSGYVSPEIRDAEKLRVWLINNYSGQRVSIRNVQRMGPAGLGDAPTIRTLFAILAEHDWVKPLPKYSDVAGVKSKFAWEVY